MSDEFTSLPRGNEHATMIVDSDDGWHFAKCETCGDRQSEWQRLRGTCIEWCDKHERDARALRLNNGSRTGTKTLLKHFRERATWATYTPQEQEQWTSLADELEERIEATDKNRILEGQQALFDEEEIQ